MRGPEGSGATVIFPSDMRPFDCVHPALTAQFYLPPLVLSWALKEKKKKKKKKKKMKKNMRRRRRRRRT